MSEWKGRGTKRVKGGWRAGPASWLQLVDVQSAVRLSLFPAMLHFFSGFNLSFALLLVLRCFKSLFLVGVDLHLILSRVCFVVVTADVKWGNREVKLGRKKTFPYSCFVKAPAVFLVKEVKFYLFGLDEDSGMCKEMVFSSVLRNQISAQNQRLPCS